jgi:hypothetical protein
MQQLKTIRKAFPDQQIVELNNGMGCNIYFDHATISVWFKKKKYGNDKGWFKYKDIGAFIVEMDKYINPKPKVAHIEPQLSETEDLIALFQAHAMEQGEIAKEQLDAYCDHKSKQGVQDCIDHIKRKAEYGKANGLNPSNVAMLNNLCEELKRFL